MNIPIGFEIAKLLKEKGFDLSTERFYPKPKCKLFGIDEHGRYYPIVNKTQTYFFGQAAVLKEENYYKAPTIAEVVMWLYEKHGIWISIQPNEPFEDDDWCFILFKNLKQYGALEGYNSPTEAYKAAIEYTIKNLLRQ